ncbi:MAG TPA: zinc-ribbon domain-containing protein [Candidatus Paceibacterota bacterium]|nr:zinc-ribbon domain-containing protein [Candidatus Paceibacterota bacterium]
MITPHQYQVDAIVIIRIALSSGGRALVVMATGLGKTIVGAFSIVDLVKLGRGLFLCHLNDGLEQALNQFREVLGQDVRLGVFHGEKKHWEEVDILFASLQTLKEWKQAFFEDEFRYVIVDESHHGQAPTYKQVIEYFKPKELLALTATPDRMDQKDIREIFGHEVVNIPLEEALAKGWLAEVEYHLVTDSLNRSRLQEICRNVLKHGKKISMKQLNETIFIEARDDKVAEMISSYGKKKTIVFCENVRHADNFQAFLPGSRVFHSKKTSDENSVTLESFRKGECQCVLVVNKMNEAIDIPDAELIVFLRCTDSKTIFLQQLGRGLRRTLDKRKVIVLDFVANADRVMVVREIAEKVKLLDLHQADLETDPHYVKGNSFDFIFTDEQIDLIEVVMRLRPLRISQVPGLAAEYSDKNPLPADQILAGSHRPVLWHCLKCEHEWTASGASRLKKQGGCPGCAGLVVTPHNNLAVLYPELVKEYSDKNPLPADQVLPSTSQKIQWYCAKCGHEWKTIGSTRTKWKHGCPICHEELVEEPSYSLAVKEPYYARSYSKRNPHGPDKIRYNTYQILWWCCEKCGCEWQDSGSQRVFGSSPCPGCGRK